MSDLVRNYPVIFLPLQNNVEQAFGKDDNELKRIYTLLNSVRGWYYSGTPPTSPNVGDKWHDSSTNIVKQWNGSAWVVFLESISQLTGVLNEALGDNIASAATVNLTTATGNLVHITGTTTITAITLGSGMRREVIFDGVLTLTHHATNNNLPGGANITTATGDRATYLSDGITVYCTKYQKANGQAVSSSAIASDAQAIAGTDDTTMITPLKIRKAFNCTGTAPVYACRAWVNFNGITNTIRASGNVSSVADNGVGSYRINFTTPMVDTSYSTLFIGSQIFGTTNLIYQIATSGSNTESAPTVNYIDVMAITFNGSYNDPKYCSVAVFR